MKLMTKLKSVFGFIILVIIVQGFITYERIHSIGNELEEIAEYQVPLNSAVMELEKGILKEEVMTFKLLLYSKNIHSNKFTSIEQHLNELTKEIDKQFIKANEVINNAISHANKGEIKSIYILICKIFL